MACVPNFGRTALFFANCRSSKLGFHAGMQCTTTTTQTPPQNPRKYRLQEEDTPIKPSVMKTYV